jgi:hypothetical protein
MTRIEVAGLLLAVGLGCGGGGGASDPIQVTFQPASAHICAERYYTDNAQLQATATLSQVPSNVTRVNVFMTAGILDPQRLVIWQDGESTFSVLGFALPSLEPGKHDGALWFELCRDPQCSSTHALTGATLSYQVEVVEPATLSVAVNGVPVDGTGYWGNSYTIASGDTVTITASSPVVWGTGSRQGAPVLAVSAQTDTTWSATISGTPSEWIYLVGLSPCDGVAQASAKFSFPLP